LQTYLSFFPDSCRPFCPDSCRPFYRLSGLLIFFYKVYHISKPVLILGKLAMIAEVTLIPPQLVGWLPLFYISHLN
jgi:hypothetical protein